MYQIIDDYIYTYPDSALAYHGYESIEKVVVKVGIDQLLNTQYLNVEIQVQVSNPSSGIKYVDTIYTLVGYHHLMDQIDVIVKEKDFNVVRFIRDNQLWLCLE